MFHVSITVRMLLLMKLIGSQQLLILCSGTVKIKDYVKLRFRNLPFMSRTVTFISTERRLLLGFLEEECMALYERETHLSFS